MMRSGLYLVCFGSFIWQRALGWSPVSLTQQRLRAGLALPMIQTTPEAQAELWASINNAKKSRRDALQRIGALGSALFLPEPTTAAENAASTAEVTDRIFVNVKGISEETKRIEIGLYGKEAKNSVAKLKALVSKQGRPAPCRPRAERSLQKEQLEANKVYNSCIEGEEEGVSLRYSQIWRIVRDEKIELGAVTGKFVAREFPDWEDSPNSLKHAPGVVSVRRGNDGGFGFAIYTGDGSAPTPMDEENIIVGRVLEGMDVVKALNEVPVVQSSKVNYMALTGGTTTKNAPTRACRYGGPMYCNEFKPLVKLSITEVGVM